MSTIPTKCPACGAGLDHQNATEIDSSRRVKELEAQVQILKEKATSAVDKLADYEDELRKLRSSGSAASSSTSRTMPTTAPPAPCATSSPPPERAPSPANRISAFLFPTNLRRSAPPSPPPECTPAELAKEKRLRMKAEERLQEVTAELEDLSASLFQSANEMVAEERRARSKLEQRVAVLEKRDVEKKERLGVLERAVDRISRVREMLTGGNGTAVP